MSGENSSSTQKFPADFKKVAGMITLTPTHVAWVPNVAGTMDRQNQAMNRVINMLASKAGSAKVSLKLLFKDDIPNGGLHFTFTSSTVSQREGDRKIVQNTLIPFVSATRAGVPSGSGGGSGGFGVTGVTGGSSVPTSTPGGSASGTPGTVVGKRKAIDGGSAGASPGASGEGGGGSGGKRPENWKLRVKVLKKNPHLDLLHRELVRGKQITEAEFWEGREALLQAEELAQAQKPGRASRLLDDRFELDKKRGAAGIGGTGIGVKTKEDTGPMVINLTKELVQEIFEEFPVVQDAYVRYVPGVSEAEFWSRYFQSQLWERHRASVRQSANDEVSRKKDDIFDQYIEEPDWNVQPRRQQPDDVERFLDLAATEEDHGEVQTQRDHTMQAGRERAALPLIRRFNDHSNKLLRKGRDETGNGSCLSTILPDDYDVYQEIDLEDLRGPAPNVTITLDVQDGQDKADGNKEGGGMRAIIPDKTDEELAKLAATYSSSLLAYEPSFISISLPTPPGGWEKNRVESGGSAEQARSYERFSNQKLAADAAEVVVKDMHVASNAESAASVPFPDALLDQMRSCHNAATEFLRQYWSAILPLPVGALGIGGPSSTSAARASKAEKMARYLKMTEGKVEAVVHTATMVGVDPARVRAALAPTVGAVNVALEREKTRGH